MKSLKKTAKIILSGLIFAGLISCSTTKPTAYYDDVYYSPKDKNVQQINKRAVTNNAPKYNYTQQTYNKADADTTYFDESKYQRYKNQVIESDTLSYNN
ncbi:MAG: hypothetical protein KA792_04245, partial [Bacteroidales bacterium]|nr:hypothetical protein [Bacteroidales bacterium]